MPKDGARDGKRPCAGEPADRGWYLKKMKEILKSKKSFLISNGDFIDGGSFKNLQGHEAGAKQSAEPLGAVLNGIITLRKPIRYIGVNARVVGEARKPRHRR